MEQLFIMYNLKKEAKIKGYLEYSKKKDQPTVKKQKGVYSFDVFNIKRAEKGKPEYTIVESVVVESFEKWVEITKNDVMRKNIQEWEKYGDPNSVMVLIGDKIE